MVRRGFQKKTDRGFSIQIALLSYHVLFKEKSLIMYLHQKNKMKFDRCICIRMNVKCEHGDTIDRFCASECCVWKEVAGCSLCLKKYHNHMGPTLYLTQTQLISLVNKYSLDSSVKPKCRIIQEALYEYLSNTRKEITTALDALCKNVVDQVGHPYLYQKNILSAYKRIKKKQYKKLTQKDFKAFYSESVKIDQKTLEIQETVVYNQNMQDINLLINNVEKWIDNFKNISKSFVRNFEHDSKDVLKICEWTKTVNQKNKEVNDPKKSKHSKSSSFSQEPSSNIRHVMIKEPLQKQIFENKIKNPKMNSSTAEKQIQKKNVEKREEKKQKLNEKVQKRESILQKNILKKQPQNNSQQITNQWIQPGTRRQRQNSLDKKIQKRFQNKPEKQQSISKKQQQKNIHHFDQFYEEQNVKKLKQQSKQQKKQQQNSIHNEFAFNNEQKCFINNQSYAYSKLPIQEIVQETKKKQPFKHKLIIIPFSDKIKSMEGNQIHSPLLKQRNKQSRFALELASLHVQQQPKKQNGKKQFNKKQIKKEQIKPQLIDEEESHKTLSIIRSKKDQSQKNQNNLKQNQQISVELLIKSLTLKVDEAIPYLQIALKHADNNLSAAQYLSYLYLESNKPKECLQLCNSFLQRIDQQDGSKIEKQCLTLQINKGAALNQLGRYSQSILIFQKCLVVKEKLQIYRNLGDAYFLASVYEKAIYNYEKSLKYRDNDETYYNIAVCLFIQENYHNAKITVERALQISPKQPNYLQLLSNIKLKIQSL